MAKPADIPEDAWREQDVGFLEGCWELDSDYAITAERTGQTVGVADWRACFDGSGRGRQDITFEDGSACDGPVAAEFAEGERLVLRDGGNVPCRPEVLHLLHLRARDHLRAGRRGARAVHLGTPRDRRTSRT